MSSSRQPFSCWSSPVARPRNNLVVITLSKIRTPFYNFAYLCHVIARVTLVNFKSTFLAASEVVCTFLKVFLQVFSPTVRVRRRRAEPMKMADTNRNVVDNINNLNERKNFVCGVVEG